MNAGSRIHIADGVEPGKRLIRAEGEKGLSLSEKLSRKFEWLTWRTPLHALRLRGRYPLKLLAVPEDPFEGSAQAGASLAAGFLKDGEHKVPLSLQGLASLADNPRMAEYLHGGLWLRDLAAADIVLNHKAAMAQKISAMWLSSYGTQMMPLPWRVDLSARRLFFWAAYAPLLLATDDMVHRSAVLNCMARTTRHIERGADKLPAGIDRITAWIGLIIGGLLIPGGESRRQAGEHGLARAMDASLSLDGGLVDRSPRSQLALVERLSELAATYHGCGRDFPEFIREKQEKVVSALLAVISGDGALSAWQGGYPLKPRQIADLISGSGVRVRPLRSPTEWGYHRFDAGETRLILDAGPPPPSRNVASGAASTLAFEMSDGPHRLIVNCGGIPDKIEGIPADLREALRVTAAHSTLVLDDHNSTSILPDGQLGKGVTEIEVDRDVSEHGSRIVATHDGYVRRYGLLHSRQLVLGAEGTELRGDDTLLPSRRRRRGRSVPVALRFHLGQDVEASHISDKHGVMLRIHDGPLWQFRCADHEVTIEESLWVDHEGWPRASHQLVVIAESPAGGMNISWAFRRVG